MALKDAILEILEKSRPNAVSGQELADALGVTRAAVWKAVNVLKQEGHMLEAATNRGYRLQDVSDVLSEVGIKTSLKHCCEVRVYDSVQSTNTTAKLAAVEGAAENTVIAADNQTKGKGRRGRSFFSPKGSGVYFSVILKPRVTAAQSVLVTTAAAVAVSRAIESLTGKHADIKWINDVYVDGKKCVGILSEAIFDFESGNVDSVIVGIGINVSTSDFPEEIKEKAGSIGKVSRNKLVALTVDNLIDICNVLPDKAHLREYRERCFVLGKEITVLTKDNQFTATAKNVDDNGRLIVTDKNGNEIVLSNEEVSIRTEAMQ